MMPSTQKLLKITSCFQKFTILKDRQTWLVTTIIFTDLQRHIASTFFGSAFFESTFCSALQKGKTVVSIL